MTNSTERATADDHSHHVRDRYVARDCRMCWPMIVEAADRAQQDNRPAEAVFYDLMELGAPEVLARLLTGSDAVWASRPSEAELVNAALRVETAQRVSEAHAALESARRIVVRYAESLAATGDDEDAVRVALIAALCAGRRSANSMVLSGLSAHDVAHKAAADTVRTGHPSLAGYVDWR